MLAIKALRLVNAENLAAFRALPSFFFVFNETPYTEFFNVLEILDHAHAILGSVPVIQVFQPCTREAVATEAVLGFSFHYLFTVLDPAHDANFRFKAVIAKASGAWFIISCVCHA